MLFKLFLAFSKFKNKLLASTSSMFCPHILCIESLAPLLFTNKNY
ncbi:hypothetical protein BVAVS116_H0108 (plasmid) [Borreliella valaisiana VS116]|uniref:Uncharacterized protein n=1 Tax=Borreliella valaisiana VS116 TaxID=445987 RepID=C0R923_BORVA|nr:hypothetical protein BVAVS116_H0108 [Borreliella valaisiana VS116]